MVSFSAMPRAMVATIAEPELTGMTYPGAFNQHDSPMIPKTKIRGKKFGIVAMSAKRNDPKSIPQSTVIQMIEVTMPRVIPDMRFSDNVTTVETAPVMMVSTPSSGTD